MRLRLRMKKGGGRVVERFQRVGNRGFLELLHSNRFAQRRKRE